MRRTAATCSLVLSLSVSGPVWAQNVGQQVKRLQQTEAEAALPDIDALERGERPAASVSFQQMRKAQEAADKQSPPAQPEGGGEDGQPIEGTAAGLAPPGGLFGLDQAPGAAEGEGPRSTVPELHVVKKGDTLWSLCGGYFGDPWRWPQLWAGNPLITNPHWIFPGDVIRLRSPGTPAPAAPSGGPAVTSSRTGSLGSKALVLRTSGFIEASDLDAAATINGSREEKIMLATGDQAYLSFPGSRPLRAGERYTVFLPDRSAPVRDPQSGKVLGYLVRIYGDLVVDQIADGNSARGTLVDLADAVERGYLVSPMIRQFKRVEPRPSAVNLELRIVASFSPTRMLAPESFVVLSRGRKDGLEVGNRTFVVRRGDGQRAIMESWDKFDPNFPKEVVGELWIVDVRDTASVAWIARSTKEIRVGETAEMRRGH